MWICQLRLICSDARAGQTHIDIQVFSDNHFLGSGDIISKMDISNKTRLTITIYFLYTIYCAREKVETKLPLIKSAFVSQRLYPASSMSIRNELKRCLLITSMNRKEQLIVLSRRLQRSVALCQSQLVVPRHNDSVPLTIHITRLLLQRCC